MAIKTYSKTLSLDDYDLLSEECKYIKDTVSLLKNCVYRRLEHEHRLWEYSLSLSALSENDVTTVLDVGGGSSAFAPAVALRGMEVTIVDPDVNLLSTTKKQSAFIGKSLAAIQENFPSPNLGVFDAVVCISVIEHVHNYQQFFYDLLDHTGSLLIMTTDFHPSGQVFAPHLRTYTKELMELFVYQAGMKGFKPFGLVDYEYNGNFVNQYTFASLVLKKC